MRRLESKDLLGNCHKTFGDRLDIIRDEVDMDLSDLAGAAGICESKLRSWKDGSDKIDQPNLAKIAAILGVSSSWLSTGAGFGPQMQDADEDMVNFLRWELERLIRMHEETGAMIDTLHRRIADIEKNSTF
jgi:HTH-type transcriptional regulator, cell division transcriptional repressor